MPKVLAYEAHIRGGLTADNKLVVPRLATDPVAPSDGWVWFNTTDGVLRYHAAGVTVNINEVQLDEEEVRDIIGTALRAGDGLGVTVDDTGNTFTVNLGTFPSSHISDFVSAVRGAISGGNTATANTTAAAGVIAVDVTNSPLLDGENRAFYLSTDNHTDGAVNHVFTAADDAKLAGIATGATANAPDATLLARANHTGTQTSATISDFVSAARSAIQVTDSGTLDLTFAGGVVSGTVLDSPTLAGEDASFYTNPDNHVDGAVNHVFTAADDTKLSGIAAGATANAADAFLLARGNHTGTQTSATISDFTDAARAAFSVTDTPTADVALAGGAISVTVLDSPTVGGRTAGYLTNVDNHVDGATNHVFTAADDAKLGGIAAGATANSTDAFLRDRTNHTGSQPASTISDFAAAVAALPLDAATLNGATRAEIETAVTAAIVDGAPEALNTLNEIAAALAADDTSDAATTANLLEAIGLRSRFFSAAVAGGAATEVITHGLGTRNVIVQVFVDGGDYEEEEYIVRRTTPDTITLVSEGAPISAGRRVVITTAA